MKYLILIFFVVTGCGERKEDSALASLSSLEKNNRECVYKESIFSEFNCLKREISLYVEDKGPFKTASEKNGIRLSFGKACGEWNKKKYPRKPELPSELRSCLPLLVELREDFNEFLNDPDISDNEAIKKHLEELKTSSVNNSGRMRSRRSILSRSRYRTEKK